MFVIELPLRWVLLLVAGVVVFLGSLVAIGVTVGLVELLFSRLVI